VRIAVEVQRNALDAHVLRQRGARVLHLTDTGLHHSVALLEQPLVGCQHPLFAPERVINNIPLVQDPGFSFVDRLLEDPKQVVAVGRRALHEVVRSQEVLAL